MNLGLGIDTGGTFTDSVIVDLDSKNVLSKAKALTTKHDLRVGIENSLDKLHAPLLAEVKLVSLSTTLATNSIVEGKGSRVGLIMSAPDPSTFRPPPGMPAAEIAVVAGAHDKFGQVVANLDARAAAEAVGRMSDKVDSFAVSCYFSIYNAEFELRLKELINGACGHPVVCGHELSGEVGMVERAVTAALNGRLLPVIGELLDAVRHILKAKKINAPVMVVKGDGSLMREATARDKPVETVLSGPAASMVGASWLTGTSDAVVVDMGGTTTDIGIINGSNALINKNGAVVGGWQTRVRSADMWTVGLGGDSKISVVSADDIRIGPRRAVPLCLAAVDYPMLKGAVAELSKTQGSRLKMLDLDMFTLIKRPKYKLPKYELALLDALDGRVLHREEIEAEIGPFVDVGRFVALGFIAEVSFTPTDLLHIMGLLDVWDKGASEEAVAFLMKKTLMDRESLLTRIFDLIVEELELNIMMKALLEDADSAAGFSKGQAQFLRRLLRSGNNPGIRAEFKCVRPIIAVGAPVRTYFPRVARELSAGLIIPEHAEVANAVGAVTGRVVAHSQAYIRPDRPKGFLVVASGEHRRFKSMEEAAAFAEERTRAAAVEKASLSGAKETEVTVDRDEKSAPLASGWGDRVLLELKVTATAVGRPFF